MPRRVLQGIALNTTNEKTVRVRVIRKVMHPVYKKFIKKSKNFLAHDPDNRVNVGDVVRIRECRPISKRKTWEVLWEDSQGEREKE